MNLLCFPVFVLVSFRLVLDFKSNGRNTSTTLLEQKPEKNQALSGIRTHDLCDASAVLSQLSYQSHTRAVVCGLAL